VKGAKRFEWELRQWFERTVAAGGNGGGAQWMRQVLIDLVTEIVQRTPVKSGRARGSWLVSDQGTPRQWTPLDTDGTATVRRALVTLARVDAVGPPISLYSNCPYMGRLENGHSKQAPNGMLAGAIVAVSALHARQVRAA